MNCAGPGCLATVTEKSPSLDFCSDTCQTHWARLGHDLLPYSHAAPIGEEMKGLDRARRYEKPSALTHLHEWMKTRD